jgi:hypothetical protein
LNLPKFEVKKIESIENFSSGNAAAGGSAATQRLADGAGQAFKQVAATGASTFGDATRCIC